MIDIQNRKAASYQSEHRLSHAQILEYMRRQGTETILRYPLDYTAIHAKGMATVLFDPGASEMLKVFGLYPAKGGLLARVQDQGLSRATLWLLKTYPVTVILLPLLAVQMALYYALALLGLRLISPGPRIALATIAMYFVVVSGMPAAVARYRVPIMPLVCVCAGAMIAAYREKRAMAMLPGSASKQDAFSA